MTDRAFGENDARNEKARNDEEDVDAGEAARNERPIGVEGDHAEHRDRAQSVDVLPEFEFAPGARRGEVGSVEGSVQRGSCRGRRLKGRGGKAPRANRQAPPCRDARRPHNAGHENAGASGQSCAFPSSRRRGAERRAAARSSGSGSPRCPSSRSRPRPWRRAHKRYDAVVASSARAFVGGATHEAASPLYVVGARTARAAEARGWRLAAPPAPDAARLVETLRRRVAAGRQRSLSRRPRPQADARSRAGRILRAGGRRGLCGRSPRLVESAEIRALASCDAALHYSRRSAVLAARLAETAGVMSSFLALRHVCLSDDVAEPLRAIGAPCVVVAERPDEAALFAALSDAFGRISFRWGLPYIGRQFPEGARANG